MEGTKERFGLSIRVATESPEGEAFQEAKGCEIAVFCSEQLSHLDQSILHVQRGEDGRR